MIASKTLIYCRYVDDIFIMMRAEEDVSNLIEALEEVSVLKFTHAPCGTDGSRIE